MCTARYMKGILLLGSLTIFFHDTTLKSPQNMRKKPKPNLLDLLYLPYTPSSISNQQNILVALPLYFVLTLLLKEAAATAYQYAYVTTQFKKKYRLRD